MINVTIKMTAKTIRRTSAILLNQRHAVVTIVKVNTVTSATNMINVMISAIHLSQKNVTMTTTAKRRETGTVKTKIKTTIVQEAHTIAESLSVFARPGLMLDTK